MTAAGLTIGALARQAGVHVETIRYYQRRGLLPEPARPAHGVRRYPVALVGQIRFIKRAQALGFTLEEVTQLLRLDQVRGCTETRALAIRKLSAIEDRVAALVAIRDALERLVQRCDEDFVRESCPIIELLTRDSPFLVSAAGDGRGESPP